MADAFDEPIVAESLEPVSEPSKLDSEALYITLKGWFEADMEHSSEWRTQAKADFGFAAGDQWSPEDKAKLAETGRSAIVFNRAISIIKAVAGIEINGRHDTVYLPRGTNPGVVKANELLTAASQWMGDGCDAEDEQSEAFQNALICGMGWCLTGDAMVRLPKTHLATVRRYSGRVIQIDLENGQKLTGTPNHPVLTNVGWKPLHALRDGDKLVNASFLKRVSGFPVEQFDEVEARLEDKVNAFRAGREAAWVPTAPDDFYADGAGSKVHIVYADGPLLDRLREVASAEPLEKAQFVRRDALASGSDHLLGDGVPLPTGLSAEGQLPFDGAHAPRAKGPSADTVAHIDASSAEVIADDLGVYSESFGYLSGREFLLDVQPDGLCLADTSPAAAAPARAGVGAECVSGFNQPLPDRAGVDAHTSADLIGRETFVEVKADEFCGCRLGDGPALAGVPAQGMASGLEAACHGGPRYSEHIADFRDWKPVLEVEARKLLGADSEIGEYVTRVAARAVLDAHEIPVFDVGTSLGMFIAGSIVTSNTEARISYDEEPDGMYVETAVDPLEMYWDRAARSKNLTDARRVFRVRKMTLDEARDFAKSLGADVFDDDLDAVWAIGKDTDPAKPVEERRLRSENSSGFSDKHEVHIVHAQWTERKPVYRVADAVTGQVLELDEERFGEYQQLAGQHGLQYSHVRQTRIVRKQAFLGATILGEVTECPGKDRFTFQCITGERDRNKGTWFGLIRLMRDPQMYSNKFLVQTLHILNTTAKGGVLAEADAFQNQREAQDTYAQPDAITFTAKGAISGGKIIPKPGAGDPSGYKDLLEFSISSIRDVTGINLELLGMRDANQPGVLEAQRKQAAMTILATMFDSLRRFRKQVGRVRLAFIQQFLADGRLIRIMGEDGVQQAVPLLRDQTLGDYEVIIEDAPTSPNQKQETWQFLLQLMPMFKGMMTPEAAVLMLEYSPLPSKLVDQFKQMVEKANTPGEEQQMQKQLQIKAALTAIDKDDAAADKSRAGAILDLANAVGSVMQADAARVQASVVEGLPQAGPAQPAQPMPMIPQERAFP
jgi:hypothetical protein